MNYNANLSVEFNNAVNNAKMVIREARHLKVSGKLMNWVDNTLLIFLDDVNFKCEFVKDVEDYLRSKTLDLLDVLKAMNDNENLRDDDFRVVNSIYDIFHEFYFED